jgi:hypothetical protein
MIDMRKYVSMKIYVLTVLFLILVLVSAILLPKFICPSETDISKYSFTKLADYIIAQDNSTFKAFNGTTGELLTSDTNETAVIQAVLSEMADTGGILWLKTKTNTFDANLTVPANVTVYSNYPMGQTLHSIAVPYVPLAYRMDTRVLTYYEPPYFVVKGHANIDETHYGSIVSNGVTFRYGTYQWKAKIENPNIRSVIYVGVFEKTHGWGSNGAIYAMVDQNVYQFVTYNDTGGSERTTLKNQDWTTETTFRVRWNSTHTLLYVDGVLEAMHTCVPTEPMQFFFEVGTYEKPAPIVEPAVYVRQESFRKIA